VRERGMMRGCVFKRQLMMKIMMRWRSMHEMMSEGVRGRERE